MTTDKILREKILSAAKDGRITCALLRRIAEETGATYKSAGKAANELKIKIKNCDLGCF